MDIAINSISYNVKRWAQNSIKGGQCNFEILRRGK